MPIPGLRLIIPGCPSLVVALLLILTIIVQVPSPLSAGPLSTQAPTSAIPPTVGLALAHAADLNSPPADEIAQDEEIVPVRAAALEPSDAVPLAPAVVAQLERLASDPKLVNPTAILAAFNRGEAETAVIVTLAPTTQALDLAVQSAGSANRPSSLDRADAPVFYDLQDQALRAQLRDTVTQALGQFIVGLPQAGLTVTQRFTYQFGFAARVTPAALENLLSHPALLRVEEDGLLEPHLRQGIPLMNADIPSATYDGSSLSIAITDTGIDTSHPRLGGSSGTIFNSKVIGGYDTGDNDADPRPGSTVNFSAAHGTACAGIAAGEVDNVGDYIGGVAPGAKLYAIKISYGSGGSATESAMIAGWEWAITHQNDDPNNPILIISTSFGGDSYAATCDTAVPSMTTAAANAVAAGISIFASSGNDGNCGSMAWPACISYVNSVGAVYDASFGTYQPCVSASSCATKIADSGCTSGYFVNDSTAPDKVTAYSNSASFLTLFAPSNQAYTTDIVGAGGYNKLLGNQGNYYSGFGGTSAACPYAAGAAAVLQSAAKAKIGSYLTPAQVTSYLTSYGTTITDGKFPSVQKPRIDLARAVDALPGTKPTITVTASDARASEAGLDPGTFTFSRTGGSTAASLTVNYSVSGTATAGSDYTSLGTSVTFAAGSSTATKTVTPVDDSLIEPDETIILTLATGTGYTVGGPASATVILTSDDVLPTVTVTASDTSASEVGLDPGAFTFSRTGDTSAALTVNYRVSGTATAGSDYVALGTSLSFAVGAHTVTKTLTPLDDTEVEADETVILTLAAGDGYSLGSPDSATVTLTSDDSAPVEDLVIQGGDVPATGVHSFEATRSITVMGDVMVQAGVQLILHAGDQIRFMPGFKVEAGGLLSADVGSSP